MKRHVVRYALGLAIALFCLGHAARFFQIGFTQHLEAIMYDAKVRLTASGGVDGRVVIVDIDEKSLKEIGRWPWSRERMALLIDRLFDRYGIAVLGLDIVFAEPDYSSGLRTLEGLARAELRDDAQFASSLKQLRPRLDYDRRFANSLRSRPVILGYYFSNDSGAGANGALPDPVVAPDAFGGRNVAFTRWSGYGANLPELQKAAAGAGHFNPVVDFDGVVRRVPMLAEYRGRHYEALSLAMVRRLLGNPEIVPGFPDDNVILAKSYQAIGWIDLASRGGAVRIPVDENAAALIPFRGGKGSFPYYSASDVLMARVPSGLLRQRIVLVGTTAPGLLDLRATPVGAAFPGVEIHANLITGMLDGNLKHRPHYALAAELLQLVLASAVMVFAMPLLSPLRGTLVALAVLVALLLINLGFWIYSDLALPIAAGLLMVLSLFALNMSWGYFVESRAKRQITSLFGQYVPPELVEVMSRDPQIHTMEGRNAELTVLFADIRGFTSIAEALDPRQLTQLINEFLTTMTAVIGRHRGTLDKYIGDEIMAFWGAPVEDPQHARHAVLAALEMQTAMAELNPKLLARGWPALSIGIGVNTGTVAVGDMGSTVRKAYTVMGDAVNLASRLEGLTKRYGAPVIVGQKTRHAVRDVVFREIDRVTVKGKGEPVTIFEPLGMEGSVDRATLDELELWDRALQHYRVQDWDAAQGVLRDLLRLSASSGLYSFYMGRVAALRHEPPGAGWNAVTSFDTK